MQLRVLLPAALFVLCGCQSAIVSDAPVARLPDLRIPPDAVRYQVDAAQSTLLIKVFRAGRMAELGHNHAISSRGLQGQVFLADSVESGAFELLLPVAELDVDLPTSRAAAGPEFAASVDQNAIDGTRANMLGPDLLDASVWPDIVVRSIGVDVAGESYVARVAVAVKDNVQEIAVPLEVTAEAERLVVHSEFSVNQTELGFQPFSVMLGALQVRDQLDLQFRIVAHAAAAD